MATSETRNIVIVGASFGGVSMAHYFLKHVAPALKTSGPTYKVILLDPSTHFWWRPSAPRAIVDAALMPHSKTFVPIMDGFKNYPAGSVTLLQGLATAVDTAACTITFQPGTDASPSHNLSSSSAEKQANSSSANGTSLPTEQIHYHALILATGTSTPTALTSLLGPHTHSIAAMDAMNARLRTAKTIVVGGGGPVGVETAGEIGEALNGVAGWGSERPGRPQATVTLVTSGAKLLPKLRSALSDKAERYLNRVGVDVRYNTRVVSTDGAADGPATVKLDNGETLSCDVYIPAVGAAPNTAFLPASLLSSSKHVATNPSTLRVDAAGAPRVYCIGDCGDYCRGGIVDLYDAVPVLGANIALDLGATGFKARTYVDKKAETQVVPVGRTRGVGAFNGWQLPSMAVKMIKGKDYMTGMMPGITEGTKWAKA